ncbi:hypothetical protein D3C77_606970 [compost metagenome]
MASGGLCDDLGKSLLDSGVVFHGLRYDLGPDDGTVHCWLLGKSSVKARQVHWTIRWAEDVGRESSQLRRVS